MLKYSTKDLCYLRKEIRGLAKSMSRLTGWIKPDGSFVTVGAAQHYSYLQSVGGEVLSGPPAGGAYIPAWNLGWIRVYQDGSILYFECNYSRIDACKRFAQKNIDPKYVKEIHIDAMNNKGYTTRQIDINTDDL